MFARNIRGFLPVTTHDVVAADAELAGLSDGHRLAWLRVRHAHLDVLTRDAHAASALLHRVGPQRERRKWTQLRRAVRHLRKRFGDSILVFVRVWVYGNNYTSIVHIDSNLKKEVHEFERAHASVAHLEVGEELAHKLLWHRSARNNARAQRAGVHRLALSARLCDAR